MLGLRCFLVCCACVTLGCEEPVEPDAPVDSGEASATTGGETPPGEDEVESEDPPPATGGGEAGPTYHQDIAPLLHRSCGGCHSDGGIAPFSIETYSDAALLAPLIAVHVEERTMPPWHAVETEECQPPEPFIDDPRLTDDEVDLVLHWVDANAPEGDPEGAAELPTLPDPNLTDASGEFLMPAPVEIDGVEDQFWCYSIDLGLDRDVWLTASQLQPGNPKVVHHTVIYTDESGASAEAAGETGIYPCFGGAGVSGATMFGAYLPGAMPTELPEGTGVFLPQGARVILGFHYHPTGLGAEVDQSTLFLRWTEQAPALQGEFRLIGNFASAPNLLPGEGDTAGPEFRIPAGATDHVEVMEWTVPGGFEEAKLFAVVSHMHYIGVDLKLDIVRAGSGESDCMLQTPAWDFNWQRAYFYDVAIEDAPRLFPGDLVRVRCTYDNSLGNPDVVSVLSESGLDEPVDVFLGDASLEEMCVAGLGVAY